MSSRRVAALLLALSAWTLPALAEPRLERGRHADRALLDRVLKESEVEEVLPRPSAWWYVQAVVESAWLWLVERVTRLDLPPSWQHWLRIGAEVAVEAASLLLVLILARHLLRRIRGEVRERREGALQGETAVAGRGIDRDRWRTELEARLATADVRGALEALWWWLASSLSAAHVDPSWTNRELLARAGRLDLLRLTRALDRMRYGTTTPSVDEIRGFLGRLEKEVA